MELGGYSSQSINLNVEKGQNKSDEELIEELQALATKIPGLNNKLMGIQEETKAENVDTPDKGSTMDEKRLTH